MDCDMSFEEPGITEVQQITEARMKKAQRILDALQTLAEVDDEIFYQELAQNLAENEYSSYMKKAGWSDKICARVEFLTDHLEQLKITIELLKDVMRESAQHD
jgi:hypothetical protein